MTDTITGRCAWGIYVITDARIAKRSHLEIAQSALAGGARVLQLRDKTARPTELRKIGCALRQLTREYGATFIVNDDPDLARELDADGVHVGQGDVPAETARKIIGPHKIVGLSTHNRQQALDAQQLPVDYIGVGPIYPTSSKLSEWPPLGPEHVQWVRKTISTPMVAIGGITESRLPETIAAGAHNVAVIREIMAAADIEAKTRSMCRRFEASAQKR